MKRAATRLGKHLSHEDIALEIDRLATLPVAGLRKAWEAEFGKAPPKALWRDLLLRMLAWRLQEKALGGHDKATLRLLDSCAGKGENGQFHERLKPGTALVREFGGTRHIVTIVAGGYVWRDQTYSSLSVIAKQITGTNWNGPRFFGLRRAGREAKAGGSAGRVRGSLPVPAE